MQFTKESRWATAALLAFASVSQPSYAQQPASPGAGRSESVESEPEPPKPGRAEVATLTGREQAGVLLGVAALANPTGGGLELDARYRWDWGLQLGILADGQAASHAYFGGTKAEGVASAGVSAVVLLPIVSAPSVEFDLRLVTGLRYSRDVVGDLTPHRDALRSVTDLAWLAHVPIGSTSLLRAGAIVTFEMETKPTQALADQGLLLTLGFGQKVTENALVYATADAGGTYGFDGDNGKVITRGALGVRWSWDGAAVTAF
jgi:hypothetical protein